LALVLRSLGFDIGASVFSLPPFVLSGLGTIGFALLQLCFSMLRIDFSNNHAVYISCEVPKCEIEAEGASHILPGAGAAPLLLT
jgi:hypothetical protein